MCKKLLLRIEVTVNLKEKRVSSIFGFVSPVAGRDIISDFGEEQMRDFLDNTQRLTYRNCAYELVANEKIRGIDFKRLVYKRLD
jgi:hypothetical protein